MKRVLLFLAAALSMTVASAQTISYEGDITILNSPIIYDTEIVYEDLMVNDLPVNEFLQTMDEKFREAWSTEIVPFAETIGYGMPTCINRKNVLDPENPTYKIVLTLNSLNLGSIGGIFNPFGTRKTGGSIIDGKMELFDAATNDSVLLITFNKIQGESDFSDSMRWALAYIDLAKKIKRTAKKAK